MNDSLVCFVTAPAPGLHTRTRFTAPILPYIRGTFMQ
jgi:hypothetical protein